MHAPYRLKVLYAFLLKVIFTEIGSRRMTCLLTIRLSLMHCRFDTKFSKKKILLLSSIICFCFHVVSSFLQ
jgi:hypothetical protein